VTKKAARTTPISQKAPLLPKTKMTLAAAISNGACAVSIQSCLITGLRAKTKTKLSRKSDSGTTQSNGMATRSVVMKVVTESSSPDGTKASAIQCKRSFQPTPARSVETGAAWGWVSRPRTAIRPQPTIMTASSA